MPNASMQKDALMMQKLTLLALAGACGTLSRYGLVSFVHRTSGLSFPLGTLSANLAGCFFTGLLWSLFESRWPVSGETRIILLIGFMGAFTTFSAFILETGELIRAAQWLEAAANVFLQNTLGFTALILGAALGRLI